jgi:transcriptional regulator with XRE-family HTH domain
MVDVPGLIVRAYRERLGLSQAQFADILGVSQALISTVEIGRGPVSRRLTRALREASESGELQPGFQEFLDEGVVEKSVLEVDFGVAQPIPLVPWAPRIDLCKPPAPGVGERFWVPGTTGKMRAFRFTPPPTLLAPDTIAVFRPARFADLGREQVVLLQFQGRHATKRLPAGVGHLGRAITTRATAGVCCQFEAAAANVPIIDVTERALKALFTCSFRGRYIH